MSTYHADLVSRRSRVSPRPTRLFSLAALRPRHSRILAAVASGILALGAWSLLAPPQLGGSTSFVITTGISMLPNFHAGDAVLLRAEQRYSVGEVAGYHNGNLNVIVMHRIVAVRGDRYVFKGDNNNWVDGYDPTADQIVGVEWAHMPNLGSVLLSLRTPAIAAFILGALWLFMFWPRSRSRRQRRRRRHAR
ncbi:MAG: S24/S26 family peptidase [Candidatus Dormibacteria bacterium]